MTHHFRTEFDMVEIPGFVKRVVFPVVVALGRVYRRYRKFADAPERDARTHGNRHDDQGDAAGWGSPGASEAVDDRMVFLASTPPPA